MVISKWDEAQLAGLTTGLAAWDVIRVGLSEMSEEASAELAWDLVEGKGERDLVARVAHQARALGVFVRREAPKMRADLMLGNSVRVEFKVCHAGSVMDTGSRSKLWGLGVFDKELPLERGDLHKLLSKRADLLVAAIPVFRDTLHAKYGKSHNVGPGELGGRAADMVGDYTEVCQAWAQMHGVSGPAREQFDLVDPDGIGRVQLNLFGFVRSDERW